MRWVGGVSGSVAEMARTNIEGGVFSSRSTLYSVCRKYGGSSSDLVIWKREEDVILYFK